MKSIFRETANRIFDRDAFQFGAFRLKLHDTDPDAPLSPFYLNMRNKNNPKPGPLLGDDYNLIAAAIWDVVLKSVEHFSAIAGIPRAGGPIASAILQVVPSPRPFRIIELDKLEKKGERKIIPKSGFEYKAGEVVLLIDDLITRADTKLEAIKAIESEGAVVRDLVVLIDREQGGREQIEGVGYNLHVAFTITELFDHYRRTGRIDDGKYWECINYLK